MDFAHPFGNSKELLYVLGNLRSGISAMNFVEEDKASREPAVDLGTTNG